MFVVKQGTVCTVEGTALNDAEGGLDVQYLSLTGKSKLRQA